MSEAVPDQSWHNPKSRWRRRMWWLRLAWFSGGALSGVVGVSIFVIQIVLRSKNPPLPFDFAVLFVFLSSWLLGIAVLYLWISRRYSIALRRVPLAEGRVCPWCRSTLVHEGDATSWESTTRVHCGKCETELEVSALRDFWANVALNSMEAWQWKWKNHPRFGRYLRKWVDIWYEPLVNGRIRMGWIVLAIVVNVGLLLLHLVILQSVLQAAVLGALLAAACIAILAFAQHLLKNCERGRYCANCEYQLPPYGVARMQCPECGADWSKGGAVFTGRSSQAKRLQWAFAAASFCLAIAFLTVTGPFTTRYQFVTTDTLISHIIAHRGMMFEHWAELPNRALTDEQRLRLAEGLLNRRDKRSILEGEAGTWLEQQITDGQLAAEFAERYRSGLIVARIVAAPMPVRTGESTTVFIESDMRYLTDFRATEFPAVLFGGFEMDGGVLERDDRVQFPFGFGKKVRFGTNEKINPGPAVDIITSNPGPLLVRARFWIIGMPRQVRLDQVTIVWTDDGTPEFSEHVLWSVEHVLEHTLDVLP